MLNPFIRAATILACILSAALGAYAQTGEQFRVGIVYGSSLMSQKDRFEFTLGRDEKVVLDASNREVYFATRFRKGQSYSIVQTAGPRQCNLYGMERGTVTSGDVLITANCGLPPMTLFKLNVVGMEAGEQFSFADNYGRKYTLPFNTTTNLGGYPVGDNYEVRQASGPRSCRMALNRGVVPNTPLVVNANCGRDGGGSTPTPTVSLKWDLASRSPDGRSFGTFYDSLTPVIGGKGADEGRYVAFVSYAKGLGGSSGKFRQIIWRDRIADVTKVISVAPDGSEGNQNSLAPAISADGQTVAFESYATNLVAGDTNGRRDVFLWRGSTGRVERVSTGMGGAEADYESYGPAVSGDGGLVAFTSHATNLIPNVQGQSSSNVYLKDTRSGSLQIISLDEKTKKGGGGSNASISEDGGRIAFYNYFPLTADDKNTLWDIYLWERGSQKLKRLSKTSVGTDRDQGSESSSRVVSPAISGDGRYVTFATTAKNMVAEDTNGAQDVFLVEVDSGRVSRLSLGGEGQQADQDTPIGQGEKISISFDGRCIVFSSNARNLGGNILLKNTQTGETRIISASQGITVGRPDISRDGNFIVFGTSQNLDQRFQSSGIFVNTAPLGR